MSFRPVLNTFERISRGPQTCVGALGDVSQVISELLFLDNEEVIFVRLNQPQVPKPLHKHADPGPCGADHLRKFFMRNLQFDAYAPQVFLAELARQLQQRLAQSLFAVDRRSADSGGAALRASAIAYCSRRCFPSNSCRSLR